jgi:Type VI secretion system effector, Hcp
MTGRVKAGAAIAAAALGSGAAIGIASVPDGNGVVHACYEVAPGGGTLPASGPNVRVIDSPAQSCDAASEHAFTLGGQPGPQGPQGIEGPQGPPGPAGASGTVESTDSAGHASVFPRAAGRTRAATALQFDVLAVQVGVTHGGGAIGGAFSSRTRSPAVLGATLRYDQNVPKLAQYCASGTHLDKVVLKLVFGGGKAAETFTLTDALIAGVQLGSSGGDKPPSALVQFVARSEKTELSGTASNRLPAIAYSATRKTKLKLTP